MASPTFDEVSLQIKALVKGYDKLKIAGTAYLSDLDAYQQILEGDRAIQAANLEESTRAAFADLLRNGADPMSQHFVDWAKAITAKENQTTPFSLLDPIDGDLFQYFIDNSKSVQERDITFGSASAGGGNVGSGLLKRLYTDRNSQDMEAVSMTLKNILCVQDANSGASVSQELFSFAHKVVDTDGLDITAFSSEESFAASGPENSLITNGSFQDLDGSAITSLTSIPGWTVTTNITNFNYDSTNVFGASPTERDAGTSYALKILDNDKITQNLRQQGVQIDPNKPYTFWVWFNRSVDACDGNLTIRVGSKSATVALVAQSGWTLLELTLNQNLWYSAFKEDDMDLEIELDSRTTGTLLVDFATFAELKPWDGTWWVLQPGATPFSKDDIFTLTDALTGSEGKIQYWLARLFGVYAPHSGTPTLADP